MELFQISNAIQDFLRLHTDLETGELLGGENVLAELEALEINRKEKQKNIILYFKNLQGEEVIIEAEEKRLAELKNMNSRKQETIKKILEESMKAGGEKELDFITCKAKFKKNPPRVVIDVGANVDAYKKVEMVEKIDKKTIGDLLKTGQVIEGCRLEQGERLDIS